MDDNRTELIAESEALVPPDSRDGFGRWVPGSTGNAGGRKKKPLTEALDKVFTPDECLKAARALAKKARSGSIAHFQEAANRLEGKVSDSDETRGNIVFNVAISAPRPTKQLDGD